MELGKTYTAKENMEQNELSQLHPSPMTKIS